MNNFASTVLDRLGPIEPDELPYVLMGIEQLEQRGWTTAEAASKLQWMEHVNPHVSEEVALRNMRIVEDRVAKRMQEA
jgi:hypothetical protein